MSRRWSAWRGKLTDAAAWLAWEARQAAKASRAWAASAWIQAKAAPSWGSRTLLGLAVAGSFWFSPVVGAFIEGLGDRWRSGVEVVVLPRDFDKVARGPGFALLQARAEAAMRSGEWPLAMLREEGLGMVQDKAERLAHAMSAYASVQEGARTEDEDVEFFKQSKRIDDAWLHGSALRYGASDLSRAFSVWEGSAEPRVAALKAAVGTRMTACGLIYIGLAWLLVAGSWMAAKAARAAAAARMEACRGQMDSEREAKYLAKWVVQGKKSRPGKGRL